MKTSRRNWIRAAGAAGTGLALDPGVAATGNDKPNAALLDMFAKRQSVRRYKSDPVSDDDLRIILDAARRAPTCMNQQPWKFLVVRDKDKIADAPARAGYSTEAHR